MNFIDVFLLALALSVDAFVVAFSYGLIIKKGKGKSALKIAAAAGTGQFVMPVLGWYGARSIYDQIAAVDHWIAFFVFLMLLSLIFYNFNYKNIRTRSFLGHSLPFVLRIVLQCLISLGILVILMVFMLLIEEIIW